MLSLQYDDFPVFSVNTAIYSRSRGILFNAMWESQAADLCMRLNRDHMAQYPVGYSYTPLNLGGAVIGLAEQSDGSIKIVPHIEEHTGMGWRRGNV